MEPRDHSWVLSTLGYFPQFSLLSAGRAPSQASVSLSAKGGACITGLQCPFNIMSGSKKAIWSSEVLSRSPQSMRGLSSWHGHHQDLREE